MKTIGLAIDKWKLKIFDRHLAGAGYAYEHSPGPVSDVILMTVKTESVAALQRVVEAAQKECHAKPKTPS